MPPASATRTRACSSASTGAPAAPCRNSRRLAGTRRWPWHRGLRRGRLPPLGAAPLPARRIHRAPARRPLPLDGRGPWYRADLITEELPSRLTLAQALASGPLEPALWQAVGRCIGRLHAHGVRHADLNAHNLVLGADRAVYVLDFDRGAIVGRGAWERDVLGRLRRSLAKVTQALPAGRFGDAEWGELLKGVAGCASSTSS